MDLFNESSVFWYSFICSKYHIENLLIQNFFHFQSYNFSLESQKNIIQFSSVAQSCPTFATPWIAARQASLSITNSQSSLRLTSIESVMPSSHLILCRPLLLLPPIPPSIRVFSNESALRMMWPSTGVSALASFLPKNTQGWAPLEWTGWISLQSKGLSSLLQHYWIKAFHMFCLLMRVCSDAQLCLTLWPHGL